MIGAPKLPLTASLFTITVILETNRAEVAREKEVTHESHTVFIVGVVLMLALVEAQLDQRNTDYTDANNYWPISEGESR
jgi:hypothetical protein